MGPGTRAEPIIKDRFLKWKAESKSIASTVSPLHLNKFCSESTVINPIRL